MKAILKHFTITLLVSITTLNCMDLTVTDEEVANEALKFILKNRGVDYKTFANASTFNPNELDNEYINKILKDLECYKQYDATTLSKIYSSKKNQLIKNFLLKTIVLLKDSYIKHNTQTSGVHNLETVVKNQNNVATISENHFNDDLIKICWITIYTKNGKKQKTTYPFITHHKRYTGIIYKINKSSRSGIATFRRL